MTLIQSIIKLNVDIFLLMELHNVEGSLREYIIGGQRWLGLLALLIIGCCVGCVILTNCILCFCCYKFNKWQANRVTERYRKEQLGEHYVAPESTWTLPKMSCPKLNCRKVTWPKKLNCCRGNRRDADQQETEMKHQESGGDEKNDHE